VLQPVVGYPSVDRLIEMLEDKVVRPAEAKFNELLARRTSNFASRTPEPSPPVNQPSWALKAAGAFPGPWGRGRFSDTSRTQK